MPGSVQGVFQGTQAQGTTASVAVSGVVSGDVLILCERTNISNKWGTSVSGLGATWTALEASRSGQFGMRFWKGVGATDASGTVTLTGPSYSGVDYRAVSVHVLQGVRPDSIAGMTEGLGPTSYAPLYSVHPGSVVVVAGYSDTDAGAIQSLTPSDGGWTTQASIVLAGNRYTKTAHRVTSGSAYVNNYPTVYRAGGNAQSSAIIALPLDVPAKRVFYVSASANPDASTVHGRNMAPLIEAGFRVTPGLETQLDTDWGAGGFDAIVVGVVTHADVSAVSSWLAAKWAGGVPVIAGGVLGNTSGISEDTATLLGLASGVTQDSNYTNYSITTTNDTHPVLMASDPTVQGTLAMQKYEAATWATYYTSIRGTELAKRYGANPETRLSAVEVGDALNSGVAPARAVVNSVNYNTGSAGWLAHARLFYRNALLWLTENTANSGSIEASGLLPSVEVAGSVVSAATVLYFGSAGTGSDPSLPSTPSTGDVVVIMTAHRRKEAVTSISGLGATWVKVKEDLGAGTGNDSVTQCIWVGTGATTSGLVTVVGGFHRRTYLAHIGGTDGTIDASQMVQGSGIDFVELTGLAGSGQVVLDFVAQAATAGFTMAQTPATGWTFTGAEAAGSYSYSAISYRVPTVTEQHETVTDFYNGTQENRAVRVLVGSTAPVTPTVSTGTFEANGLLPTVEVTGLSAETGTVEASGLLPTAEVAGNIVSAGMVEAAGLIPAIQIEADVTVTGSIEATGLLPAVAIEGTFTVGAVLGQVDGAGLLPSADFDVDIVAGGEIGVDVLLPTVEFNGDVIGFGLVAGAGLLPTIEALGEVSATGTLEALGILPTVGLAASVTVYGEVAASGLLPSLSVATSVLVPVYYEVGAEGLLPALLLGGTTYISNPVAESLYVPGMVATGYIADQKYAEAMSLPGLVAVTAFQPSRIAVRNR